MYIIAEMAYGHDGKLSKAKQIATSAKNAGADALSIHVTDVETYIVPHYGSSPGRVSQGKEDRAIFEYLKEISLNQENVKELSKYVNDLGLDLIVMPNDHASFILSKSLGVTSYVVAPTCMQEFELIENIAKEGKPIYLRIGGATLSEIGDVIELIQKNSKSTITILYGHQDYPTKIEDNHLRRLETFSKIFSLPVGLADHLDADDEFAPVLPILAIPYGITCIEKHLTVDRSEKGEDFESALNEAEFASMVENVRLAELALGSGCLVGYGSSSARYRFNTRKRVVAARDLAAGEIMTKDICVLKRSDEGIMPADLSNILGMVCHSEIKKDEGITYKKLRGF